MLGVVKALAKPPQLATDAEAFLKALDAWRQSESIGDLADLLSFSVDGALRGVLADAARAALKHSGAPRTMKLVAQEIFEEGCSVKRVWRNEPITVEVRTLRALLREAPNDTVALVDLAQHHLSQNKSRAAERALLTAYQISPRSVYVVRAFARFWIHRGRPDRAHALIKSSGLAAYDPWVMASEIAIAQAAGGHSIQLRKAQRALATKLYTPTDISELAGAVAGFEITNGNFREARKLFRLALEHPNDNVLAQAITNQQYLGIEVDEQIIKRAPNGVFEGRALNAMLLGKFEEAAGYTASWSEEESFSSRPRMLQSYFFGALGEYQKSLSAAEAGLLSDPKDDGLRANRAYALAGLERFTEAEAELKLLEAKDAPQQRPSVLATRGMVFMLQGQADEGIRLYEAAVVELEKAKAEEQVSDCLAFMARTAFRADIEQRDAVLARANERFALKPSPAASVILKSMQQTVADVAAPELRKIVQWEWDPTSNTLSQRKELTRIGAPGFVVADRQK